MNGIGIGIGRKRKNSWSYPLQDKYKSLLAAVSQKPSKSVQNAQNTFMYRISGGNSDSRNTLAKLSCIIPYFAGMPLIADSAIWWNNPARKGILHGTLTYEIGNGITGDAIDGYIDNTFNPSVDGGALFTQNNASVGWWFMNERATYNSGEAGIKSTGNGLYLNPWFDETRLKYGINADYVAKTNPAHANMLFIAIRDSSTTENLYLDRTLIGTTTTKASAALYNTTMFDLASNNGSGSVTAGTYMSDTIGLFLAGALLDATDVKVICDACDELKYALASSTPILYYLADGTTIDEDIWTITNPQPLSVEFEQNNVLLMRSLGVASTAEANKIETSFNLQYGIISGSYVDPVTTAVVSRGITMLLGTTNYISLKRATGITALSFVIYYLDSNDYIIDSGEDDFIQFKIIYSPTHKVSFYKWYNDVWTLIGESSDLKLFGYIKSLRMSSTGKPATETTLRDLYITQKDFNTLTP